MNSLPMTTAEKMLFALLKAALHGDAGTEVCWKSCTDEDWQQCYKLASTHGVMALAWDGIALQNDGCVPPRALKLTWGLAVQSYEEKYERYCGTVADLQDFYAQNNIAMVQLKGVGLSTYYPVPAHREGGDIDIYTWSAVKSIISDQEANRLADELMKKQGIDVETDHSPKHSNFYYKGIPVENHKTFLDVFRYKLAAPMNELLHTLLNPREVKLCGGIYQVHIPSPEFNALFLTFHAAQHFGNGIRLHHLLDWAFLLKKYGWCLPKEVTDERLLDFICALTHLCNRLLDMDIPVKGGEPMVSIVYEQMMHPLYPPHGGVPVKGVFAILRYKTKRLLYIHRMQAMIFDHSLWRRIWESIVVHIRKPKTILMRG